MWAKGSIVNRHAETKTVGCMDNKRLWEHLLGDLPDDANRTCSILLEENIAGGEVT